MAFAGVRIVTLSEGDVTRLHVGLKGTMNALFLKDLADKTRRGLRGRIEDGKSGGGLCFGYDVVKQFCYRTINIAEAAIVRRIFDDYIAGKSSRAIAWELNKEGVPGPQGSAWGPTTIHGCDNRLNIRRDAFQASVLSGLRSHLMEPQLFKEFCEEFTREVNRLRIGRRDDRDACRNERDRIDPNLQNY
jgi:hypothetical protein